MSLTAHRQLGSTTLQSVSPDYAAYQYVLEANATKGTDKSSKNFLPVTQLAPSFSLVCTFSDCYWGAARSPALVALQTSETTKPINVFRHRGRRS